MSLLKVTDLQTDFRIRGGFIRAVDGVSFSIEAGETLGIVGESGSGKSVTSLSLLGLIPQPPGRITGGTAYFEGKDLLQLPEEDLRKIRGNKIAMIFQDPMTSLNPFLTVGRQLTEVLEVHQNKSHREARRLAIEMLDQVGISDATRRIDAYPHQLSGGMRQRVMIAIALLCRPSLLIADEPTTALDVTIQAQILDLLRKIQSEMGMALILITHNLGVVTGICDRVLVMYAGHVVEESPMGSLFQHPRHPYTRALLRSVPRLDEGKSGRLEAIRDQPPDLSRLPVGCRFHPRCDFAVERCSIEEPTLDIVTAGHRSACWKAGEV
ncbi:MAG: ABC transporter ATP-binding protein [Deltaproteobacteria bacterium]|nr:ABC transporter ATP-binding protein [Deltaproteobacteria bacterium]